MHRDRVDAVRDELVLLVLHQRDERADHDREPGEHQRGELVDERLAAPRGHHDDGVAPVEEGLDRLPLPFLEIGVAEAVAEQHDCAGFVPVLRHAGALGQEGCRWGGAQQAQQAQ